MHVRGDRRVDLPNVETFAGFSVVVGLFLVPAGALMAQSWQPTMFSGEAMLAHDGEEGGFIVRGYLEVTVRGETRVLGPLDAYRFDSRLPHRFRNIGTEDCVIISAATPPTF
jgi:mannose-6-phosphate isomerase-like protein (cupin superfamily)